MKRLCSLLLIGASTLAPAVAFAQGTPMGTAGGTSDVPQDQAPARAAPPPPQETGSAGPSSGDIVVTAQRRAERLQDVPITITNLGSETLRKSGAGSLTDIAKLVPSLRFDNRAGLVQPTIRGVGTPINLAGAGTNVGIYVDGFYNPAPLASDFQLLNVNSIEVLKGPQGTLFGRNTSGGAILVSTSQPSTTTSAIAQASYGSYNAMKLQGYFTTGLTDRIAFDIGALYSRGDGYVTNIAPKDAQFNNRPGDKVGRYENWSVRAAIKADVRDNLTFTLRYIHDERDDPTPILYQPYLLNGRPLSSSSYIADPANPTGPRIISPFAPLKPLEIAADEKLAIYGHTDQVQLAGNLDLGFATLSSYTMWRKDKAVQYYSLDYGITKTTALIYPDDNKTFTQEFILASKGPGHLKYTLGAFYYNNKETYPGVQVSFGGNPFFQSAASGVNSVSLAGFADLTYEIVDNLFLTGGVRYTHDEQKDAYFISSAPALVRTDVPTLKNNKVTPRAVIRYQLNPRSSVYASYSQGFKSAIINVGGGTLTDIYVRPEKIDAYEIGYKYASRALTFDVSGYYYNYRDQQITANYDSAAGVPQSFLRNAAASHIYGIDADLNYVFSPHFQINLGAGYNHARFSDFPNAPYFAEVCVEPTIAVAPSTTPTVVASCSASNAHSFVVQTRNATGNHMSRSPDFTATAQATYSTDLAGGKLDLSGTFYYTSKFYFDTVEEFSQNAYATLGLRAEWTDPSDRFTFGVAGSNVTNKRYLIIASANSAGIASAYGAPRTVEGYVRFKM